MKHLSHFKTHLYEIKLKSTVEKATIWLFGDVHRDLPNCDVERWKWFLRKAREDANAENTYYLGMGDYHDFASAREGKKMKDSTLHDQTYEAISELIQKRNRVFAIELKQMRGRLIGLIGGNHTWILENGITSDEDLANRLACEYLGWLSYIEVRLTYSSTSKSATFGIVACHGVGGGRVLGSQVRKVEDLFHIFPGAMIYAMGHDHSRGAWPQNRLFAQKMNGDKIKLRQERQFYCRSGSFMKSYMPDESSYPVGKLMRPSDLGALRIDIGTHQRDIGKGTDSRSTEIIKDIQVTI